MGADLLALAERLERSWTMSKFAGALDMYTSMIDTMREAAAALREAHATIQQQALAGITASDENRELSAEVERLRALLREAHSWLSDDRMTTWPYMEGSGGFYVDRAKWIARIDAELGEKHE